MKYTPVGVDIAKHLIQVQFINEHSGEVVDRQLRSMEFLAFFSNLDPCLIGMEACGGSQHWAGELEKPGHKVRLMQGGFVKAFVMGNKNDVMDARAIWMAVQQPVVPREDIGLQYTMIDNGEDVAEDDCPACLMRRRTTPPVIFIGVYQ